MPGGAARDDGHLLQGTKGFVRDVEVLEEDLTLVDRDATEDRVSSGGRLLENLLEHEVPMAALLCGDRIP